MDPNRISERLEGGRRLPLAEDFYTIQGEGCHAGKPAYFIRLAGCDVGCPWCDAKYTWNPARFPLVEAETLAERAAASGTQAVILTGGEPFLYPLGPLTDALRKHGLETYMETSGTHPLSGRPDWICLSPKKHRPPLEEVLRAADELKVVIQSGPDFAWAEACAARAGDGCRLYLQPEWSVMRSVIPEIVRYVKAHPRWNISLQTHKFMDIP